MNVMKKLNAVICGVASIFVVSNDSLAEVIQKYPSTYEKDVQKSLQNGWGNVGKVIKGAIDEYGTENKKAKTNS